MSLPIRALINEDLPALDSPATTALKNVEDAEKESSKEVAGDEDEDDDDEDRGAISSFERDFRRRCIKRRVSLCSAEARDRIANDSFRNAV